MLSPLLQRFAKKSPLCLSAGMIIARLFESAKLDRLFNETATQQYERDLLFSTVFSLMSEVVCARQPSVHAAYQAARADVPVSVTSVYNKLAALEPTLSAELLRYSARQLAPLVRGLEAERAPWVEGLRTKIVDGTCIDATEHRLRPLRAEAAAPLPGKVLAVYEPALGLITDLVPCEDGHAQERRLFGELLADPDALSEPLSEPLAGELWIADRNFCTRGFLFGLAERGATFLIRQHANLPWEALEAEKRIERERPGEQPDERPVYEQPIRLAFEGRTLRARRIRLVLSAPTRNGETEICLVTTLKQEQASAQKVAQLYRGRWQIETAFQDLATHLKAEPGTLGYPRAALFALTVGLVAYNVLATLLASLRSVHGAERIDEGVSGYYIAIELANTYAGMLVAVPESTWSEFGRWSVSEFVALLRDLASKVALGRYRKHKRGPKKPPPRRRGDKRKPHVSTAKVLAQQKAEAHAP
jgi:hypothetical protein